MLLAIKTGWSRTEILGLAPAEFNHYINVIMTAQTDPEHK